MADLKLILQDYGPYWRLSSFFTVDQFAEHVTQAGILSAYKFRFEKSPTVRMIFWTQKADLFDIALSLAPRAYLSHASALFMHGVIQSKPKTIYVSSEQNPRAPATSTGELEQEKVTAAFARPQRKSNATTEYHGQTIMMLTGSSLSQDGMVTLSDKPVTSIERTIIDVTVRPAYAGGVNEVLKSYVAVRTQVNVKTLIAMLDALNFTYPYFQSIGFYLERAGYTGEELQQLRDRKKHLDFYLDYAMEEAAYSSSWRLFYPASLDDHSTFS